jgi:hypothetical protein
VSGRGPSTLEVLGSTRVPSSSVLLAHVQSCAGAGALAFTPSPPPGGASACLADLGLTPEEVAPLPAEPRKLLADFYC